MKKSIKPAILAVLVITAIVMSTNAIKSIAEPNSGALPAADAILNTDGAEFFLRDCDGIIGVFKGADPDDPIELTEIKTETLNENDRKLIKTGIPAADRQALLRLLEDFSS